MCDYSLHSVKTRPAKLGERLTTHLFASGTKGFCGPEDTNVAVCLLPGTELSFAEHVGRARLWLWSKATIKHTTAIFRQINMDKPATHHDALEFPDGKIVLLNHLKAGQRATVLQLPVKQGVKVPEPKSAKV